MEALHFISMIPCGLELWGISTIYYDQNYAHGLNITRYFFSDSVRCGTSWNSFIGKKRCYEHSSGQLVSSSGLLFQNVALSAIELPADEREKRTRYVVLCGDYAAHWSLRYTTTVCGGLLLLRPVSL